MYETQTVLCRQLRVRNPGRGRMFLRTEFDAPTFALQNEMLRLSRCRG